MDVEESKRDVRQYVKKVKQIEEKKTEIKIGIKGG